MRRGGLYSLLARIAATATIAVSIGFVVPTYGMAVTGNEPLPESALGILRKYFRFDEMTGLLEKQLSEVQVRTELDDRYLFDGSQTRQDGFVEGYRSRSDPLIAVTLSYIGTGHLLFSINVLAFDPAVEAHARELKTRAFDSVDAATQPPAERAKLYFLGIHRPSGSHVVKVMLREDQMRSGGSIYSVQYAFSAAGK